MSIDVFACPEDTAFTANAERVISIIVRSLVVARLTCGLSTDSIVSAAPWSALPRSSGRFPRGKACSFDVGRHVVRCGLLYDPTLDTMAVASNSTTNPGAISRLISTNVLAGAVSPNASPWAADVLPVVDRREVGTGPHDIGEIGAELGQRRPDLVGMYTARA